MSETIFQTQLARAQVLFEKMEKANAQYDERDMIRLYIQKLRMCRNKCNRDMIIRWRKLFKIDEIEYKYGFNKEERYCAQVMIDKDFDYLSYVDAEHMDKILKDLLVEKLAEKLKDNIIVTKIYDEQGDLEKVESRITVRYF